MVNLKSGPELEYFSFVPLGSWAKTADIVAQTEGNSNVRFIAHHFLGTLKFVRIAKRISPAAGWQPV
jgi:hypothetical protein